MIALHNSWILYYCLLIGLFLLSPSGRLVRCGEVEGDNPSSPSPSGSSSFSWRNLIDTLSSPEAFFNMVCPSNDESTWNRDEELRIIYVSPTTFKDVPIKLDPDDLRPAARNLIEAGFKLNLPSLVYSHGFMQRVSWPWMKKLRKRYADIFQSAGKAPTYNLLLFDYAEAGTDFYQRAVSKVPTMGKILADFLSVLRKQYKYSMNQLHLVGFSLSTHIMGVVGRRMRDDGYPVRQITALDPAGPCFFKDNDFSRKYTLTPDAANLVVARHYNFGRYGSRKPIGGVDIYVNGGDDQPSLNEGFRSRLRSVLGLNSHIAAVYHEVGSAVDSSCYDMAYECDSYDNYLEGACARCSDGSATCYHSGTLINGANRNKVPKYRLGTQMYTRMGGDKYCLHQYQLVVQMKERPGKVLDSAFIVGKVRLNLESGQVITPTRKAACDEAIVYTKLVASEEDLSSMRQITIDLEPEVNIGLLENIESIRLNYMSHPFEERRRAKSLSYCPTSSDPKTFSQCSIPERGDTC